MVVAAISIAACGSSGSSTPSANAPKAAVTTVPAPTTTAQPKPTTITTPFGPSVAIDLSGTPGVTPTEQARSEKLVEDTIAALKKYDSPLAAYAAGFRSIGDRLTGDEHYVNWSYVDDGHILDPSRPESLVYEERDGAQHVAAAMYMLPFGSRFTDAPNVGGPLTQWHIHANLCLSDNPEQRVVAGLTSIGGGCPPGSSNAGNTPMIHVWVQPNECGPFAALEGIGAGQVPDGQTRRCDTRYANVA